jgi:hypothetical protein
MLLYVHVTFTHRFVVEKTVFGYIQIQGKRNEISTLTLDRDVIYIAKKFVFCFLFFIIVILYFNFIMKTSTTTTPTDAQDSEEDGCLDDCYECEYCKWFVSMESADQGYKEVLEHEQGCLYRPLKFRELSLLLEEQPSQFPTDISELDRDFVTSSLTSQSKFGHFPDPRARGFTHTQKTFNPRKVLQKSLAGVATTWLPHGGLQQIVVLGHIRHLPQWWPSGVSDVQTSSKKGNSKKQKKKKKKNDGVHYVIHDPTSRDMEIHNSGAPVGVGVALLVCQGTYNAYKIWDGTVQFSAIVSATDSLFLGRYKPTFLWKYQEMFHSIPPVTAPSKDAKDVELDQDETLFVSGVKFKHMGSGHTLVRAKSHQRVRLDGVDICGRNRFQTISCDGRDLPIDPDEELYGGFDKDVEAMRQDEAYQLEVGEGENDNPYDEELSDVPVGTLCLGPDEPLLYSEFGSHLRVTSCFFAHSYNAAVDAQQAFVLELANTQFFRCSFARIDQHIDLISTSQQSELHEIRGVSPVVALGPTTNLFLHMNFFNRCAGHGVLVLNPLQDTGPFGDHRVVRTFEQLSDHPGRFEIEWFDPADKEFAKQTQSIHESLIADNSKKVYDVLQPYDETTFVAASHLHVARTSESQYITVTLLEESMSKGMGVEQFENTKASMPFTFDVEARQLDDRSKMYNDHNYLRWLQHRHGTEPQRVFFQNFVELPGSNLPHPCVDCHCLIRNENGVFLNSLCEHSSQPGHLLFDIVTKVKTASEHNKVRFKDLPRDSVLFEKSAGGISAAGDEHDPLASAKEFVRSNGLVEELKRSSACYKAAISGGLVGNEYMMAKWKVENSELDSLDAETLAKLGLVGEHSTLEQALKKDVEQRNKAVEARRKDLSRLDTMLDAILNSGSTATGCTDPMLALNLFAGVVRTSNHWDSHKAPALLGMAACRHLLNFAHAEIMVSALQCHGWQDANIQRAGYMDCCFCEDEIMSIAKYVLLLTGGSCQVVLDALAAAVMNPYFSCHGRTAAADILTTLSDMDVSTSSSGCSSGCSSGSSNSSNSRIRDFAVDVIAQAFCQTSKNGLTPDSRSQFLGRLRDLKAVEVAKKVRSRFKMERDCVDSSMDGGYIEYLRACGLKINPKDKQVIYEMGDGMKIWSHNNDSQEKVNKQIAKVTSRMTRKTKNTMKKMVWVK